MEVRNETTLKKLIKEIFKRSPYSFKKKISDKLLTTVELDIPEPSTCPTCR